MPKTSTPNNHSTDEDTSVPTSEGKSTAHNTKRKTGLPDIEQEGPELMPDHHKVPKANSLDEVRSNESSTAGDQAPAGHR